MNPPSYYANKLPAIEMDRRVVIVMKNILTLLVRTGDVWRQLTSSEYLARRAVTSFPNDLEMEIFEKLKGIDSEQKLIEGFGQWVLRSDGKTIYK